MEHASKSYVTLDEECFRSMAAQFDAAMLQMQKQLESIPPEQRKQVEEMMKSQMPAMNSEKHKLDVVAEDDVEMIGSEPVQRNIDALRDALRGEIEMLHQLFF